MEIFPEIHRNCFEIHRELPERFTGYFPQDLMETSAEAHRALPQRFTENFSESL